MTNTNVHHRTPARTHTHSSTLSPHCSTAAAGVFPTQWERRSTRKRSETRRRSGARRTVGGPARNAHASTPRRTKRSIVRSPSISGDMRRQALVTSHRLVPLMRRPLNTRDRLPVPPSDVVKPNPSARSRTSRCVMLHRVGLPSLTYLPPLPVLWCCRRHASALWPC